MDNCDLEKLSVDGVRLCPQFRPEVTLYTAAVPSSVHSVRVHLTTSDCAATCNILSGDRSGTVQLEDGLNRIDVEVIAEDGTAKTYTIQLTKLSANMARLTHLTVEGHQLQPGFTPDLYEYCCAVGFDCLRVSVGAQVTDPSTQITVREACSSGSVPLNAGDTPIIVQVTSPDGANSQVYTVTITREQIPLAVTFCDVRDQMAFECPVSLNALYRPVSINQSDSKAVFSSPYIDMLTRRSKVHPFTERPLGDSWRVVETELDSRMSNTPVNCCFTHRGCKSKLKLAEVGAHVKDCPYKPSLNLNTKEVTETNWYRRFFTSSGSLNIDTEHSLQIRNWEKRLQTAVGEGDVEDLCSHAQNYVNLYRSQIPKPGDMMQYEEGHSPLDCLEQAAIHYATAIKFKPQDSQLHFLLGKTLEEFYYASEMYGLKKKAKKEDQDLSEAQTSGRREEILAICGLHGFSGTVTVENQLKALDKELQLLKQQGQSGTADYVQTLYIWLSKTAGKVSKPGVCDEEHWLHRASLKYLNAWSLSPDKWELNLHVGRLLLLQGRSKEALQHLYNALALAPAQAALRFYTGLTMLQQPGASVKDEQEAILFLQQGLENVMGQCFTSPDHDRGQKQDAGYALSIVNVQFLRGCLSLGALLSKHVNSGTHLHMSPVLVYHTVAVFAARAVSVSAAQGEVVQQLEWVLLDAHFALLRILVQQQQSEITRLWTAQRCQALGALIRLSCIDPCRELLDMQERVCEMGVVTTPCSSTALCLLGLAQLAQYDSDSSSVRGQASLADARLSFQASIALEGLPLTGDTPELLTKQAWWQDHWVKEKQRKDGSAGIKATGVNRASNRTGEGTATGRGRSAAAAKSTASVPARGVRSGPARRVRTGLSCGIRTCPAPRQSGQASRGATAEAEVGMKSPGEVSSKVSSAGKSRQECSSPKMDPAAESVEREAGPESPAVALNRKSCSARLGLARALSRSPDSLQQACSFYREVIALDPEVYDAYIELGNLLVNNDPLAAVDVYSRFPFKPVTDQTFDEAFITGEIVRILMKQELYDHPQLVPNLIAYGKVMGLSCLEKYIDVLDKKFMTQLLKTVYAGIHDKSVDDEDLQQFFKFKCWI